MESNSLEPKSDFVTANGVRFHFVSQGGGPTVLLLHGFPEHWFSWRHQLPALAGAGYRAVALDLRGYNLSERPSGVAAYHLSHLIADVRGMIDALGGEPVHLVGHDWGGAIAWNYAAFEPARVRSLSILNAPHPKKFLWHLTHNPAQLKRSWYILFFQLPFLPEWSMKRNASSLFDAMFRGWARRKEQFPSEVVDTLREAMHLPGVATSAINYYRAIFRDLTPFVTSRRFPRVTVPTQVIWGEDDRALGLELNDGLEKEIDAPFEMHRVTSCSHWVQQEAPEEVNALLKDFFARYPSKGVRP